MTIFCEKCSKLTAGPTLSWIASFRVQQWQQILNCWLPDVYFYWSVSNKIKEAHILRLLLVIIVWSLKGYLHNGLLRNHFLSGSAFRTATKPILDTVQECGAKKETLFPKREIFPCSNILWQRLDNSRDRYVLHEGRLSHFYVNE